MGHPTISDFHLWSTALFRVLSPDSLQALGKASGFHQRIRKCSASDFAALCIWISQHITTAPLVELCTVFEIETGISITPQALNQRFNTKAVSFLQQVFQTVFVSQLNQSLIPLLNIEPFFSRIRILDSTTYQIHDIFEKKYPGAGGSSNTAGIKIQLEYDLLSGQFLNTYCSPGSYNDKTYGSLCLDNGQPRDLFIRDLGYFDLSDFKKIKEADAFFISRVKLNTRMYCENPTPRFFQNGEIIKDSQYKKVDLEAIMQQLDYGETLELSDIFCGGVHKLPVRLICYRLEKQQLRHREAKKRKLVQKKGIHLSPRSKRLLGLNIYITNIPSEITCSEQIHRLYALRWQIEILFKTWKSIFHIHQSKKIKQERLECQLYGQLIAILFASTLVFKMRQLLYQKQHKIVSEYKAMYVVYHYLPRFHQALQLDIHEIERLLLRIYQLLDKNGRKSVKSDTTSSLYLLQSWIQE